jgi:hypothetical protein
MAWLPFSQSVTTLLVSSYHTQENQTHERHTGVMKNGLMRTIFQNAGCFFLTVHDPFSPEIRDTSMAIY